jgi:hypothetical protein
MIAKDLTDVIAFFKYWYILNFNYHPFIVTESGDDLTGRFHQIKL